MSVNSYDMKYLSNVYIYIFIYSCSIDYSRYILLF